VVEPSNLADDETVLFFPRFAVLRDGAWQVPIDVWVYEPEEGSLMRKAMLEVIGEVVELRPGSPDSEVVEANLLPFMADNERGKFVALRRGAHAVRVGPTGSNGRATGTLSLPEGDPAALGEGTPPWIELEVVLEEGDPRRFSAWAQLLPDEGVSVVSDIDDTIKITEVHDRIKMMENTFLHPYRAVPGMADVYRRWAGQGVAFSYVSAGPLPLLRALTEFAKAERFPRGSLALRPFRWKDRSAFDLLKPSEDYKRGVIETIVEAFEKRVFVLVGDTGERDPEIYAAIARKYPERVQAIYLRDPQPEGTDGLDARLEMAFEGLPRGLWQVIGDGSELPAAL